MLLPTPKPEQPQYILPAIQPRLPLLVLFLPPLLIYLVIRPLFLVFTRVTEPTGAAADACSAAGEALTGTLLAGVD